MTPLEKACQVFWDEAGIGLRRWGETGDTIKGEIRAAMQKTLLALAECDIPVGDDGIQVEIPMLGKMPLDKPSLMAFRAILRSIANEGKDNG